MTYAPDATALVGNTPLVRINRVTDGAPATVLAKVEAFEPAASVKDRIALSIVRAAEASGDLKPGGTIVEATSGNTGVGLAMVGAALGYKVIITMPETMSKERRACAQRYAHRCRGLAPYRHRQQQHAGAMGMEDMKEEGMVHMTDFTITSPP